MTTCGFQTAFLPRISLGPHSVKGTEGGAFWANETLPSPLPGINAKLPQLGGEYFAVPAGGLPPYPGASRAGTIMRRCTHGGGRCAPHAVLTATTILRWVADKPAAVSFTDSSQPVPQWQRDNHGGGG